MGNQFSISTEDVKKYAYDLFNTKSLLFDGKVVDFKKYLDFYNIPSIKKIINNVDMINTANNFFNNGLNTSQASINGFMHRNTMVYRLQKIKSLTGLDIRSFNDAVVLNNLILFKDYLDSLSNKETNN